MGKAHLERMLKSMRWADQRILAALRDHRAVQGEALPLIAHLLAAEHVWLCRLEQREARLTVWPQLTVSECESLAHENAAGYSALLSRLSEEQLCVTVRYRTTKGQEFATAVIDILTQVVIHGAYHRGQIAKVFGRNGVQAVNTDFITFVREAEPT
jgi:uncharacterized damage-inducible protein DinB